MPGIHHTAIVTADVERSMRFWCDGLGFTELFDHTFTGDWPTLFNARTDRLRSIFLGDPNAPDTGIVELVQFDRGREERDVISVAAAPPPPDEPAFGFFLLSLQRDVDATLAGLAGLGFDEGVRRIEMPAPGGKTVAMAVITAPDGVRVELIGPPDMTAVVTGGGSGIGSAVVDRLRTVGADVVVWDIKGGDIHCDISDPESVSAAIEQTVAGHGTPDRLVACAGVGASGLLLDQTPADWQRVIDTNLTGTWLTMRAVARAMIDAGSGGSIVAVSSISGTLADRDMGAYCVSKAGIDMLVRVAATEWGAHGIRVNAVGPGVTRTPMLAKPEQLPGWVEGLTERTALGRLGEADDVAEAIVAVLEMSWVTGQTVFADGGLALHSPIDAYGQVQRLSARRQAGSAER